MVAMMRATLAIVFLCGTEAAAPLVTFESPCSCQDNHGVGRWSEKNDPSPPTMLPQINRTEERIFKVMRHGRFTQ
jgi:hypothetical protein